MNSKPSISCMKSTGTPAQEFCNHVEDPWVPLPVPDALNQPMGDRRLQRYDRLRRLIKVDCRCMQPFFELQVSFHTSKHPEPSLKI